jgi:mono/diheme cytochrome c family protein
MNSIMRTSARIALAAVAAVVTAAALPVAARADDAQIERGKYLVHFGGCNDCHTPGYFFGKPDMAQYLGGSDVAFEIPGLGAFAGPNITPDKETGIGGWTTEQIVTTLQTGARPDGRILAPIMPWRSFAGMSKQDATAIAAYLKSVPPVHRRVAGPFAPGEKITSFLFRILPPGETAAAAK